jgi:hypothetical protein
MAILIKKDGTIVKEPKEITIPKECGFYEIFRKVVARKEG